MHTLTIIVLIAITLFAYYKYNSLICPAVIHNIFWILSLIGLYWLPEAEAISGSTYCIIIAGSIIFQLGHSASRKFIHNTNKEDSSYYCIKTSSFNILTLVLLIPFSLIAFQFLNNIRLNGLSSWYSSIKAYARDNSLFDYLNKWIQIIFLCFLLVYWKMPKNLRRRNRLSIIALFIMSIFCVISKPSRNSMLFFIAPLIIIYFITHKLSKKKIILIVLLCFFAFMIYFYLISKQKYYYLYEQGESFKIIKEEILTYLSGSIIALDNTIEAHSYTGLGAYSFRFFTAIFDTLFGTDISVSIVNEFAQIGGIKTNVFTFYDFYIRDFGVLYALIAQFIVSFIHGIMYRKMKNNDLTSSAFYAFLVYPLIMQFFQDQYLSLFSTWLQITLIVLILFKSKLFIYKRNSQSTCTNNKLNANRIQLRKCI